MENKSTDDKETGSDTCEHCLLSFPWRFILIHESLCPSNPNNTPGILASIHDEKLHPTPVAKTKTVSLEAEGRDLIVVIGKNRCGKTTIIDQLVGDTGVITPNGEFEGSFRSFVSPFKKYTFMEPYGDSIRNLISALCLADLPLVVIDSSEDFNTTHPTQDFLEHCSLAKAFGFSQLICCFNKMDLVQYSEDHFKNLKNQAVRYLIELGFVVSRIRFVPVAALQQENITERTNRLDWYKGSTLLKELDTFATTSKTNKTLRMVIHTATNDNESGIITARVHSGWVLTGSDLQFCPGSWSSKLETIKVNIEEETTLKVTAGELGHLVVKGPLDDKVKKGCVVSSSCQALQYPDPIKEALAFTTELLVVDPTTTFTQGPEQYTCIAHEAEFTVVVSSIPCSVNRRTGKENLNSSSALKAGELAVVHFSALEPAVVEKECKYPSLGRIAIFKKRERKLLAVGVIRDVETDLYLRPPADSDSASAGPSSSSSGSVGKHINKRR